MGWQDAPEVGAQPAWMNAPEVGAEPATQPAAPKQVDSAISRFLQGAADPVVGIGQKVAHAAAMLPIDALKDNAATYDDFAKQREADYSAPEGVDLARISGNVVSPINLLPAGRGVQLISKLPTFGQRALASIPAGAALGLSQPVTSEGDFATEAAKQTAINAALGPVAEGIGNVASKVVAPAISDAAKKLIGENIRLTPGQALGGMAKAVEDKATSIPILGDMIQSARGRGLEDLNVAVANRALEPIGQSVPKGIKPGRELISHVDDQLGKAYDKVLTGVKVSPDQDFMTDLTAIKQEADLLPRDRADQFANIIRDKLANQFRKNGGDLDGEGFKAAQSEIGRLARQYRSSADADQRQLGSLLDDVGSSLRDALVRSNPAKAEALSAVNKGYANFVRLQRAASSVGADEGAFTAAQLQNAVKASDQSVRKGRFARGDALMQDLSDAAKKAMPSKVPDSGTPARIMQSAALGGGLGVGALMQPNLLLGVLGGAAAYSRPGQYLLRQYLTPGTARNALASSIQGNALAGLPALLPLIQQGNN